MRRMRLSTTSSDVPAIPMHEISELIDEKLNDMDSFTYRGFEKSFNKRFAQKIKENEKLKISKDFILRARTPGELKIPSERVIFLCKYLGIEVFQRKGESTSKSNSRIIKKSIFEKEFRGVERLAEQNPSLEKQIKSLLTSITVIASTQEKK